jgi:hypothetical protein
LTLRKRLALSSWLQVQQERLLPLVQLELLLQQTQ